MKTNLKKPKKKVRTIKSYQHEVRILRLDRDVWRSRNASIQTELEYERRLNTAIHGPGTIQSIIITLEKSTIAAVQALEGVVRILERKNP
jgi:hypothetical protein